ncbi:hypothetical protein HPP92_005567 [Vanilla planifolia]|uniref:Uncharacterized protein n=1 Tax=Vanilla planifolia TaxID=51239 RepID=A0A835RIU7_VANPL|nr:hypothetical protein HPP92_005567 [Vanilla planifolia]
MRTRLLGQWSQKMVEDAPDSWNDLMAEMASYSYQNVNPRAFILRTKAMLMKMDQKLQLAKLQASIYQHLASIGVPKNMHCLSLRLAEEYLLNANARSSLPPPEYAYRLTNASYIHIALLTDNILGAAVVVSSTVACSRASEDGCSTLSLTRRHTQQCTLGLHLILLVPQLLK